MRSRPELLELINHICEEYDLRVGQLMDNLKFYLFQRHNRDIFHITDSELYDYLEEYVEFQINIFKRV